MRRPRLTVNADQLELGGRPFLARGLRCSNALFSEQSAIDLIANLNVYIEHGLNTVSVFLMGNRFGDIAGYRSDASLEPVYADRLESIIKRAEELGIVVIVGCLYWGESRGKHIDWTQDDMNRAVANTAQWVAKKNFGTVILDPDNEGMARQFKGINERDLVLAGKRAAPDVLLGINFVGDVPAEADVCLHFADPIPEKPYIESEGVPENSPGAYWGKWSRRPHSVNKYRLSDYWNYENVGVYTDEMKEDQIRVASEHFDRGWGYLLASTWLQAVPPLGPNHTPGGDGSVQKPGIQWWLEYTKARFGAYHL